LRIEVASLKFPTPDHAVEDGTTGVLAPDGSVPSRARYTNFFTKKDGQWLLASVREAAYVTPSNYENLRDLEWVIGEWVDDNAGGELTHVSSHGHQIKTSSSRPAQSSRKTAPLIAGRKGSAGIRLTSKSVLGTSRPMADTVKARGLRTVTIGS